LCKNALCRDGRRAEESHTLLILMEVSCSKLNYNIFDFGTTRHGTTRHGTAGHETARHGTRFMSRVPRLAVSQSRSLMVLSDYNLLDLHAVAVNQAQHVDTGSDVDMDAGAASDGLVVEDAASDVNHLQHGGS